MNIRPYKKKDLQKIASLYSEEWKTGITDNALDDFNSNNNHLFVVDLEGEIIGVATLHLIHKLIHNGCATGFIENVIVSKKFRSSGVGKKIINFLIKRAERLGCYNLFLSCDNKLEDFYKNSGMEKSDQIIMKKMFSRNFKQNNSK